MAQSLRHFSGELMANSYSLNELAEKLSARLVLNGNAPQQVSGLKTLQQATASDLSFLANPKYKAIMQTTKAAAVIISDDMLPDCPTHALVMKNPYLGFAKVGSLFDLAPASQPGVHATAVVAETSQIDKTASIGAHVVIGERVVIGPNVVVGANSVLMAGVKLGEATLLKASVTVYHNVLIGKRCIIHSGAVIGSDGFGNANDQGRWIKIPQLGIVVIGDDVEIGANTTVDRGTLGDTEIHSGAKIDNLVQIAHNVVIGEHTAIAAKVGIAGSTSIGKNCMIGGAVGISGHLTIADKVIITGMTMVTHSIHTPGVYSSGIPVKPQAVWHKNVARFARLDKMAQQLKALEAKIAQLIDK